MTYFPSSPATEAPAHIAKYLDPDESLVVHRRFHWAVLLQPVSLVVAGVFVTISVDVTQPVHHGLAPGVSWLLWALWILWSIATIWDLGKAMALRKANARTQLFAAVVVAAIIYALVWLVQHKGVGGMLLVVLLVVTAWAVIQIAEWVDRFLVLTNKRIVVIEGIIGTTVRSMPVSRLTDMAYRRTPMGRALRYGLFDVESAGQDQALKLIEYVPDPDFINAQITHLLFKKGPKPDPKNIVINGNVNPASGNVTLTGQMDG